MEKEFITYKQALALRDLGFDEPCFVYWVFNNVEITFSTANNRSGWSMLGFRNSQMDKKAGLCTAPTYSQAFRWFRKKYEYEISIHKLIEEDGYLASIGWEGIEDIIEQVEGKDEEEAESKCLDKLIELVKDLAVVK